MIVLFTSIFAMMSLIDDRKEGFLLSVMVAPVPRSAIVLGKVLGGTTLSAIQGMIFLLFAPFAGVHPRPLQILLVPAVVFLVSFALTALSFAIAWPMDSTQAFHGIINLFLIPLWLLSGAMFSITRASGWLRVVMYMNPLTYGVDALRALLYPGMETFPLSHSMATLLLFSLAMFGLAFLMANRRTARVRRMIAEQLSRGLRARYDRHRIIARWTFPLWMYVSVTGVIVYFMLYQWFPHS